ncbi:hypothetical protein LTR37_011832 [Vermiconidia calcicola]|uniref:Uncharacterized protein n=1 Tax=Vermiconidia calcicola TaxID=1690605 RepID=A0ACC3N1F6_9PEZI|nr:hypothetical protein LTR37_011832 [Vermiconidia calcicola]
MGANTWDDTPAATASDGFKPDDAFTPANDGFSPDAADEGFTGDFAAENISKHAGGGPGDGGCRVCGSDAHFAKDCPDKPPNSGECYNCGEMGHSKADCVNPRVEREFTGTCRVCEQAGHRAADCPSAPPQICKVCFQEGHKGTECAANRLTVGLQELSVEDAWKMLEDADKDREVDSIKKAILAYAKAYPDVTFEELEGVFREAPMQTYLIAKEQQVSDTHTIVNLQGKADQKYVVSIQFGAKPRRAKFAEGWPSSPEENLTRLVEAGWPMDRMVPKCDNCGQLGHIMKSCPEEKREKEQVVMSCGNCNEPGHRNRDCDKPRKTSGKTCKNCGSPEHIAKDCPEPRNMDNVECRECGESE